MAAHPGRVRSPRLDLRHRAALRSAGRLRGRRWRSPVRARPRGGQRRGCLRRRGVACDAGRLAALVRVNSAANAGRLPMAFLPGRPDRRRGLACVRLGALRRDDHEVGAADRVSRHHRRRALKVHDLASIMAAAAPLRASSQPSTTVGVTGPLPLPGARPEPRSSPKDTEQLPGNRQPPDRRSLRVAAMRHVRRQAARTSPPPAGRRNPYLPKPRRATARTRSLPGAAGRSGRELSRSGQQARWSAHASRSR